jgi:tetratricopeptide (TPR) repeat protein
MRRLTEEADPAVRLALEVALAQFDGPAAIKAVHLQSEIDEVAELAWQAVSNDPSAKVSIETLAVLAAKSKSYRARRDAAEKLRSYGLRVMTDAEKAAAILTQPRFKQAQTAVEIEALIADYKKTLANRSSDGIERRVLAALHHRKGLLLLKAGDFEKAAPLLMGGEAEHELYADEAFALQTLGRFNDAANSINRSVENEEQAAVAKQLVRNGYLAFAQGEFENASMNFSAARTVSGYLRDQGPVTLIQYLSELLFGKKPEAPSIQRPWISDSGFGESEGSPADASWPETASFYIRGKLPETEVFARIEKQKGRKESDLCEAHFFFAGLCRGKGNVAEEMKHLQAALETKVFTTQCFSLAMLRFRELSALRNDATKAR